jgi:hypothetical protein
VSQPPAWHLHLRCCHSSSSGGSLNPSVGGSSPRGPTSVCSQTLRSRRPARRSLTMRPGAAGRRLSNRPRRVLGDVRNALDSSLARARPKPKRTRGTRQPAKGGEVNRPARQAALRTRRPETIASCVTRSAFPPQEYYHRRWPACLRAGCRLARAINLLIDLLLRIQDPTDPLEEQLAAAALAR